MCGGIVALWSEPVGIQIDGLEFSLAGSKFYFYFCECKFYGTFEIVGSKLMGLKDETSIGFFPGLGIIIICEIFNDLGQYLIRSMALNIYIRLTSLSFGSSFSILVVMRSRIGAFFLFNILISSFIPYKVHVLRRSCDGMGVAGLVPLPDSGHY